MEIKSSFLYPFFLLIFCFSNIMGQNRNVLSEQDAEEIVDKIKKNKMNIIFFLVDDLGWMDLGYQGSKFYESPRIDSFSRKAFQFSNAYAAATVCSPTRGSILTGQYPARTGLTDWLPGRKDFPFQKLEEVPSEQHLPYGGSPLPKVLRDLGYATAIFGKWHLGHDSASTRRQGFDLHIPNYNTGWPNGTYYSPFGMEGLDFGPKGEYLTDRLTTESLKWIENHQFQPFFLFLSHFAVHDPIQGRGDLYVKYKKKLKQTDLSGDEKDYILEENPDEINRLTNSQLLELEKDSQYHRFSYLPHRIVKIKQKQDNPRFAAMVEAVDESFGRVLDKLEELDLEENTIVIFFSDNGGMSGANFGYPYKELDPGSLNETYSTSNLPLRGAKGWMYEGGIREPLLIYWPGHSKESGNSDIPVISTDFYPTILDMIGAKQLTNGNYGVDGRSLTPILTANSDKENKLADFKERPLFWHWPNYSNHGQQSPSGAIRLGEYKLIEYFENFTVQLFDLKNDIGEKRDLSNERPEKVQELRALLHKWRNTVGAKMPKPNPDYNPNMSWPNPPFQDNRD